MPAHSGHQLVLGAGGEAGAGGPHRTKPAARAAGGLVGIAAVAVLLGLAYERFVWRLWIVRRFTRPSAVVRDLAGDVKFVLRRLDRPVLGAVLINQTAGHVTITGESSSTSAFAELVREPDRFWSLRWTYTNTPRKPLRGRSDRHLGTAEAGTGGENNSGLMVEYFTDRSTSGEIQLVEWSPFRYGSWKSACHATNFRSHGRSWVG